MESIKTQLPMALLASLTLGLAPFVPEPHLIGKLRWVAGGAHGMALMDWLDLLMHGAPWLWLTGLLLAYGWHTVRNKKPSVGGPSPKG
jgi:hypothetical protein